MPTLNQFRHIARLWATHFGGTVAPDAHVRLLKSGNANVTCRGPQNRAFTHNVTVAEALSGKLANWKLDHFDLCAADAAEAKENS